MKYFALLTFILGFLISTHTSAQTLEDIQNQGFEVFEYQDGDTTYFMKKYFMCFLKSGDTRSQNAEEAGVIQQAHLKHISQLAADKKICMSGPFADDGNYRGILLFSVTSEEEARSLAEKDPAVMAGRLAVEIRPIWLAVGTKLF